MGKFWHVAIISEMDLKIFYSNFSLLSICLFCCVLHTHKLPSGMQCLKKNSKADQNKINRNQETQ